MLRPCLEPLQVLQKARQKLQKVAKEGMAAAIVKQDHAGVLRFSALFPPLGYQVCGPSYDRKQCLGPSLYMQQWGVCRGCPRAMHAQSGVHLC